MRVDVGVVFKVIQKPSHIPPAENIRAPEPRRRAGVTRAVLNARFCGFGHGQRVLALHHKQLLPAEDTHPLVCPLEVDLLVTPYRVVECFFEWMAADTVEDGWH